MRVREGSGLAVDQRVVVLPKIGGAYVASKVVFVKGAMEVVGSALGDHLDLAARRAVEIRGLVAGADLELFDALDGSGHHTGRRTAGGTGAAVTVADRVGGVAARHVVAVVAAIQLEAVLVGSRSGHVAGQRYADLQNRQARCVAAEVRQQAEAGRYGASNRWSR